MQADDERGQRREIDVLELVDGHEHSRVVVTCHLAELDEQAREVSREIARVGGPEDGLDVDVELVPVGEAQRERLQDAEGPPDPFTDPALRVHRQEDPAEGGGET